MFICFVVVAAVMGASFNKNTGYIPSGPAGAILAFECLFTAGFAWSWGGSPCDCAWSLSLRPAAAQACTLLSMGRQLLILF